MGGLQTRESRGTRKLSNGALLADPKIGELGSEYSCVNMKRKTTTRSK